MKKDLPGHASVVGTRRRRDRNQHRVPPRRIRYVYRRRRRGMNSRADPTLESRRWCAGLLQQCRPTSPSACAVDAYASGRPGLWPGNRLHPRRLPLPAVRPDQRQRLHRIRGPTEQPRRAEARTMITPEEAKKRSPLIGTEGMLAALVPGRRQGHARIGRDRLRRRGPPSRCPHHPALRGHRHRKQRRRDHRRGDRTRPHRHQHGGVRGRRGRAASARWLGWTSPSPRCGRQIAFTEPITDLPSFALAHHRLPLQLLLPSRGQGPAAGLVRPQPARGLHLDVQFYHWLRPGRDRRDPCPGRAGLRHQLWLGGPGAQHHPPQPDHRPLHQSGRTAHRYRVLGDGFLMGPGHREIVRDLYHGKQPGYDISSFALDRFARADIAAGVRNQHRRRHQTACRVPRKPHADGFRLREPIPAGDTG